MQNLWAAFGSTCEPAASRLLCARQLSPRRGRAPCAPRTGWAGGGDGIAHTATDPKQLLPPLRSSQLCITCNHSKRDGGVNKVGGPEHPSDWRCGAACWSVPSRALLSHYLDIKDNRDLSFSHGGTLHNLLNLKAPSSKRLRNIVMGSGAVTRLGSSVTPCCMEWRGEST